MNEICVSVADVLLVSGSSSFKFVSGLRSGEIKLVGDKRTGDVAVILELFIAQQMLDPTLSHADTSFSLLRSGSGRQAAASAKSALFSSDLQTFSKYVVLFCPFLRPMHQQQTSLSRQSRP
jgi:hypothetical protein